MPDPGFIEGASQTGQILKEGGPWGLFSLALAALAWAVRAWRDEAKGRLDDQKVMGEILQANSVATSEQTRANEVRNEVFKESVKSQELAVVADRAQAAVLLEVKNEVAKLVTEQSRTNNQLIARGVIAP
jgi:hypothetical protein